MTPPMTSEVWKRDEPDSPCQTVCLISPETRLCLGCRRTPEEISGWAKMTPVERAAILVELPNREDPAPRRRGGRKSRVADRKTTT